MNSLFFGDNLDVLRQYVQSQSVDLVYLDPPFNSNADYNILYGTRRGGPSKSQSHAFDDMWKWGPEAQRALDETAERHLEAGALLDAFQKVFPKSNMMAYMAMMAVRLIELRRVLKPNGSLYLHCDPTASHYLKVLTDTVFGTKGFQNEITWKRTFTHGDSRTWSRAADKILFYTKSDEFTWNIPYEQHSSAYLESHYSQSDQDGRRFQLTSILSPSPRPNMMYEWKGFPSPPMGWRYSRERMAELDAQELIWYPQHKDGSLDTSKRPRFKRYLDEQKGTVRTTIWTDIAPLNSQAQERLGYPTQKPLALLKRIINASSNKGDVVLDPFCGCGTAIEAAQELDRQWIGIDITYLAMHVIEARLVKTFGKAIKETYELIGRPEDADDARALAARDWLEFQKWAVMTLGGLPKERPGADGGIDGIIRYHRVGIEQPNRAVVSVKGGVHVGVDAIHKLKSVVQREKAELGVLVCLERPTAAMVKEAASEGDVGPKSRRVSKIQIITVDMLFQDDPVRLPGMLDPPEAIPSTPIRMKPKKSKRHIEGQSELLLPITGEQTVSDVGRRRGTRSIRSVDIEVTPATARTRQA